MIDVTTYAPPSDSMAVFCQAVNRRRLQLGITQDELARRAGMDPSDLSKRLKGKKGNCSFSVADKIAKALDRENAIELITRKD